MMWFTLLVVAVGLERLAELVVSTRNAAWSLARGGVESGQRHYVVMVMLHTGLLVGALVEVWLRRPAFLPVLGWTMLVLVLAAQALRWWCIVRLGHQWNTRVIVVPGLPRVTGGPYRVMSHPTSPSSSKGSHCRSSTPPGSPRWCSRSGTPCCCRCGSGSRTGR